MTSLGSDGRTAGRDKERLLTVAGLYLLPVALGLRTDSLGPNYLLMLGLTTIVVSKVIHLREAVLKGAAYPAGLALVDLAIILDLAVMFQCLANPSGITVEGWRWSGFSRALTPQNSPEEVRASWLVFWSGGLVLFALIVVWTLVVETRLRLRRRQLGRYLVAWLSGAVICSWLAGTSVRLDIDEAFAWYRGAAVIGFLLPATFLALELTAESLFDRIDLPRDPLLAILFRAEAKAGMRERLLDFLKWDCEVSLKQEPGTLRFDVWCDPHADHVFYVYEAYRNADAFEAHRRNEPYRRWEPGLKTELVQNFTLLFEGEPECLAWRA